jgi:hypothetical protein
MTSLRGVTVLVPILFLGGVPLLRSDDIVLNSGEVIEGKIDRAATDAANKGKTDPNQTVIVIVTDEAGTRKTIPHPTPSGATRKKGSRAKAPHRPRRSMASSTGGAHGGAPKSSSSTNSGVYNGPGLLTAPVPGT